MAVVSCVSVRLELTPGRTGMSQALRLGGRGVVPESPPAGPAFGKCPIKGLLCHASLPAHFGLESEDGSSWSRGRPCCDKHPGEQGTGRGRGLWAGRAGCKAHGCRGSREGGATKGPPQLCEQVPLVVLLVLVCDCPSGPLARPHHRCLLRAKPALPLSAE